MTDIIEIHEDQIPFIMEWAKAKKYETIDLPFKKVLIVIKSDNLATVKCLFKANDNYVTISLLDSSSETLVKANITFKNDEIITDITERFTNRLTDDYFIKAIQFHTLLVLDIFQYMTHTEYIEKKTVTKRKTKPQRKKKATRSARRYIKVTHTVYHIDTSKEPTRRYKRHTHSWNVRGHWRYYKKTDKRVWIQGYTKGKGEISTKTYKI